MTITRSNRKSTRWLVPVAGCVLVGALAGCALSKPPTHAKTVEDALPSGTVIPTNWSSATGTNLVANEWLRSFNDPRLETIVAEAITNNLDLREAAARVEIARQQVTIVGSKLKPRVGAVLGVAGTKDEHHDDWYQSNSEYLGIAWEPDVWGRVRSQRSAAESSYESTALDYAFARQSLAATVAKSWYLAIETRQLVALSAQSVSIYSNLLELVRIRRAAGKVTDLDVAEAGANLNAAQSQLRYTEEIFRESQRNLEVLLGRYPAAELEVAESYVPLPSPVEAGLPSGLLTRRPDLMAVELKVREAFRLKEAASLALLPSFSLNAAAGHLSDNLLSLLQLNPWMLHTSLGMYVPIYEGGALRARIRVATARQQAAVAAYGNVALVAFREVENGLTNERLQSERLQFQSDELKNRTEAVRLANMQYKAGAIDLLSLLQLQEDQIATQRSLIKLRNSQLANRINLHLALGGLFNQPAASPDSMAKNTAQ